MVIVAKEVFAMTLVYDNMPSEVLIINKVGEIMPSEVHKITWVDEIMLGSPSWQNFPINVVIEVHVTWNGAHFGFYKKSRTCTYIGFFCIL